MFAGVALNSVSPEALAPSYVETLGMRVLRKTPFMRLGYGRQGGCLE